MHGSNSLAHKSEKQENPQATSEERRPPFTNRFPWCPVLHANGQESCTIHQYHLQSIQSNNSEAQEKGWLHSQRVLPTVCAAVQQVHGGVYMADQLRKAYSCRRRSRKWWLPLFYFMVDISMVNSYILHRDTPHASKLTINCYRTDVMQ